MDDARTDEELLRATAGEPRAFELFYLRYAEAVLAYFAVRTRQPEAAADLAAETFAAALRGSRRYRPSEAPAAAWLFAIARNKLADAARRGVVADRARRRLRMQPLQVTDDDLERVETLADLAAGGRRPLLRLLDGLPAAQREAVVARILDERDYPEIARELSCSEAVVRQRVSRGLATLRAHLEEEA
ncbi:RNA polymerase sigma factor [Conexibacter arvalis]|uniref:RNA polymerase sigma-70 factor (ECF subfamily) n=1 Tax=Conexibacter arvalis TaxID=912552 RepID=A0A840IF85_9ACTN|nr:RNA polymerase sigma factor [Conexibacter arvalis]MBB4663489.1 RNA polymerase sigma-70 factor (ECF subfamily) [Conexibacter arvalis]